MSRRYKVWAVGDDATRQRTALLQRGCLERDDGAILLLRSGSSDESRFDVGAFDGTASEVAMLACELTGYEGTVEIKDFGNVDRRWHADDEFGDIGTDEAWSFGRARADGASVSRGRRVATRTRVMK